MHRTVEAGKPQPGTSRLERRPESTVFEAAARRHACVVEEKVRGAKLPHRLGRKLLHLAALETSARTPRACAPEPRASATASSSASCSTSASNSFIRSRA